MALLLLACHGPNAETAKIPTPHDSPIDDSQPTTINENPPVNVLMLSIDTLRRKAIGRYNDESNTPFLDRMASEGLALDAYQTCSAWTYPGVTCVLTGHDAHDFGFLPRIDRPLAEMTPLPEDTATLASLLATEGYQTILVSANPHLGPDHRTDLGYQSSTVIAEGSADVIASALLARVDDPNFDRSRPWLLHGHFLDPHAPYNPPDAYKTALAERPVLPWNLSSPAGSNAMWKEYPTLDAATQAEINLQLKILYGGEVRFTDDTLSALVDALDARGLLDQTLIVFWNDHGEAFEDEHGDHGHASSLYYEQNDGLAFFWHANGQARAWTEGTSALDILPTTLDFLQIPIPDDLPGAVVGTAAPDRPRFATLWPKDAPPIQMVTIEQENLLYSWTGHRSMFDRAVDPDEQDNIYNTQDDSAIRAWTLLQPEIDKLIPLADGYTPLNR